MPKHEKDSQVVLGQALYRRRHTCPKVELNNGLGLRVQGYHVVDSCDLCGFRGPGIRNAATWTMRTGPFPSSQNCSRLPGTVNLTLNPRAWCLGSRV